MIRTLRDELTRHVIPGDAAHLRRLLLAYKNYYNHRRAHQGLGQRVPARSRKPPPRPLSPDDVLIRREAVNGLITYFERKAASAA